MRAKLSVAWQERPAVHCMVSLPSKKYGPRKRQHRTYWKGDIQPPTGQAPGPLTTSTTEATPPTCQKCGVPIKHPYVTCYPCYAKLDDSAKHRIRAQWSNKGKWANPWK